MVYLYSTLTGFEGYFVVGSLGARKCTQKQFVGGLGGGGGGVFNFMCVAQIIFLKQKLK
jgi:hypothetical protein